MPKKAAAAASIDPVVARQNTSIEVLAEAIESLCMATVTRMPGVAGASPVSQQINDAARADLRTALRAFVAPHLRLIEGGGHQEYEESIPKDDRVVCGACQRDRICSDVNCPHWHAAIRDTINPPDDVA